MAHVGLIVCLLFIQKSKKMMQATFSSHSLGALYLIYHMYSDNFTKFTDKRVLTSFSICVLNLRLENKENGCTLGVYPIFEKNSTSRTRLKINFFTVWLRLVCDIGAESAPLVGIGLRYPPNLPTCKQPCPISQTFWGLANNQWNKQWPQKNNKFNFATFYNRITKPYVKLSPCLENIFWSVIFY